MFKRLDVNMVYI